MSLARRAAAEAVGTGILVATIVGSGIMAAKLAGGNVAVALLGNTLPTGAILIVLITLFGPVSGAHFNPAVSAVMAWRRTLPARDAGAYAFAQVVGGIAGAIIANLMFDLPAAQFSTTIRSGIGQWLGELIATAGLLLVILGLVAQRSTAIPMAVGLYITAAYWFTSSTSFANPAVTIARMFSDTFAGIAPGSVPAFILAQIVGAVTGAGAARLIWPEDCAAGD